MVNPWLLLMHFFGGVFAVVNGVKLFKKEHSEIEIELLRIIAAKDRIIKEQKIAILKLQQIIDYDNGKHFVD